MTTNRIKQALSLTNVLMCICVVLFVGLTIVLYKLYKKGGSENIASIDKALNAPVRNWTDDQGRVHAEKPAVEMSKELAQVVHKSLYDSVCNALDISKRQIESLRAAGTVTTQTIKPESRRVDSTCEFNYSDKWFKIGGRVCSANDSIGYEGRDSFIHTTYWKRDKILGLKIGKKTSYFDAYSLNPNTTVVGLTGIDITDNSFDRIELSGYTGYRSQFDQQVFNAGLEAEIHIRCNVSVELWGEYYLDQQQFRKAFGTRLKLSLFKF